VEGEKPHPANYRGCRHAKEEMQKKKSQRTSRTTTGKVFFSNFTTTGLSFAAAIPGRTEEQQQPQINQVAVASPAIVEPRVPVLLLQHEQQTSDQSVQAPNVNSLPLDKMLRAVIAVVQHFMTEFNDAVIEEAKIVANTKIVLNYMEQNGQ
jgi:hypothetical protein